MISKSYQKIGALLVLILLVSTLIYLRFPDFFVTPNRVIEPYADGFKSYTTIEYHAKYDSTYSFYTGMQYPYKEHVIPAATQPLLSNLIRFIHRNITPIADQTNAIVNFSLLLGILLAAIFLFLIFDKLGLPKLFAIGMSIGITFLAPQFERLVGHYGLAHLEVIPCLIYLLMRYDERPGKARSLMVMMGVLAFSMIHFYYFAMQVFLISGYFFFRFMFAEKSRGRLFRMFGHYFIQVGIPLIFFLWWLNIGESVNDRTSQPYGFLHYLAQPQGIFYSQYQPYFDWLQVSKWGMENRAYIGLFALFGVVVILLRYLVGLLHRRLFSWGTKFDVFCVSIFVTSLLILLFSFGFPFVLKDMAYLLDYAGPIRQFRSIGRFAWVFYYVVNIVVATSFFYFFVGQKPAGKWRYLWLLIPVIWVNFEAYNQSTWVDLKLDPIGSARKGHTYLDVPNINYNDYQAIISLPNFSIGSDNFWVHPDGAVAQESQVLSIQTGLPLTAAMLTRTSLSRTIKELQFVSEPYRYPLLLNDLKDNRPFIIVTSKIGLKKMAKKGLIYDHLLKDATFLFSKNVNADVLRLSFNSFKKRVDEKIDSVREALTHKDSLFQYENFWVSDSSSFISYQSFDDQAGRAYQGTGGFQAEIVNDNMLFEGDIPKGAFYFTGWFFYQKDLFPTTVITITVKRKDGTVIYTRMKSAGDVAKTFDNNGWGLISIPFSVKESGCTVTIRSSNDHSLLKGQMMHFDELLIYPQASDVYLEQGDWMMKNNRWFRIENQN